MPTKTEKVGLERETYKVLVRNAHEKYIQAEGETEKRVLLEDLLTKLLFLKHVFGEERVTLRNGVICRIDAILPLYVKAYLFFLKRQNHKA